MNPFKLTPILTGEAFCNREKELEDLNRHAVNSTHVVLFSPRRLGKTSLVLRVMDRFKEKRCLAGYIPLASVLGQEDFVGRLTAGVVKCLGKDITSGSLIEQLKRFFTRIVPSIDLKPEGVSISVKYDRDVSFYVLAEDIFESLNRYLENKKARCLLVFDEFQQITGLRENSIIESVLRDNIQMSSRISCFFVGSRRRILKEMFMDSKRPFYKMAVSYQLGKIPQQELVTFITDQFDKTGKRCDAKQASRIYSQMEGHTYYVQKLAHFVWDRCDKRVTEDMVSAVAKEVLEIEAGDFQSIFDALNQTEKRLVVALSQKPTSRLYERDFLDRFHFPGSSIQRPLKSLLDKDILEIGEGRIYRITDPLFAQWCRASSIPSLP
ncbi:MAG TPA: ATP-binding protein [Syntrophorhabdales bacterium]|nr:ATP-binding protein [Syntrophorhabdales bacterium]